MSNVKIDTGDRPEDGAMSNVKILEIAPGTGAMSSVKILVLTYLLYPNDQWLSSHVQYGILGL
jgi:hypothetical protein